MIQKRTTEPSKNSVHAPWIHAAGILTALWLMIVFLITAVEPNEMRGSILPVICTFRDAFDYDPVTTFYPSQMR